MKLFVVFATVLVVATSLAHSAAVPEHSATPSVAADETEDNPRLILTKLAKLALLKKKVAATKGGSYGGNGGHGGYDGSDEKDIVVVYVKEDKKHGGGHHGNNNHHYAHYDNNNYYSGSSGHGHYDSHEDQQYVYRRPVKKVRPVRWESYEDSGSHEFEYVRPNRHHGNHHSKPQVHVTTVHTQQKQHHGGDKGSSWGNWLSEKFGNKFNKDSHHDSHEDHDTQIIIKKKNNRGHGHDDHDDKWDKFH